MTETILTPFDQGEAIDLSALTYRKRVLKPTVINYKGRTINFDEKYIKDLANSYASKAFEQVPFTLANDRNEHTDDPERVRGDVIGMDMARPGEAPGLYANIAFPSEEAAKALLMNPKLAVSCRLSEVNGRPAVKHVCGTTDARVADLGPWQTVSLSADETGEVIDLTNYTEGSDMAAGETDVQDFTDLSAEQIDQLLADAAAELGTDDPDNQGDPVDADLSNDTREAIDLARSEAAAARAEAAEGRREIDLTRRQLSDERWGRERDAYAHDGVPAAVLDLASPLLTLPTDQVIDLANPVTGEDEQVNASDIVRGILEEFAGTVNLSRPVGRSQSDEQVDLSAEQRAERKDLADRGIDPSTAETVKGLRASGLF